MPRGGIRPNAGRKANPNSARQQALAKKSAKGADQAAPNKAAGRGFTLSSGEKSPDAPGNWPFGTKPAEPPATPPPAADPEKDDGLTDEQRAGLSPLDYLLAVMRSPEASKSARMTAAIQAAPYMHCKLAPMGKKETKQSAAKGAGQGKFGARGTLKVVGGSG